MTNKRNRPAPSTQADPFLPPRAAPTPSPLPPPPTYSARDIALKTFSARTRRGYDPAEVDAYLMDVARHVDAMSDKLESMAEEMMSLSLLQQFHAQQRTRVSSAPLAETLSRTPPPPPAHVVLVPLPEPPPVAPAPPPPPAPAAQVVLPDPPVEARPAPPAPPFILLDPPPAPLARPVATVPSPPPDKPATVVAEPAGVIIDLTTADEPAVVIDESVEGAADDEPADEPSAARSLFDRPAPPKVDTETPADRAATRAWEESLALILKAAQKTADSIVRDARRRAGESLGEPPIVVYEDGGSSTPIRPAAKSVRGETVIVIRHGTTSVNIELRTNDRETPTLFVREHA